MPCRWGAVEQVVYQGLKDVLCTGTVLAQFDPALQIGILYDSSNVGIGVVLFNQYTDGRDHLIANNSKMLTDTECGYS